MADLNRPLIYALADSLGMALAVRPVRPATSTASRSALSTCTGSASRCR